jgi:anti-sigma B factor antagonist
MTARLIETSVSFQDPVAIIKLVGEIDAFSENTLNEAYSEAEGWEPDAVLLDFSAVDYINSTGIALIVNLLSRSRRAQRKLMICGLSPHFQEIFRITRLSDFIELFASEAEALAKNLPAQI